MAANELQQKLKNVMKQEIAMMREVLANMHQEELTLQLYDQRTWTQILQDRGAMIKRLGHLRQERIHATEELNAVSSLDHALAEGDDEACEILSMRDQLMALIERINAQQSKNQVLYERGIKRGAAPSMQPAPRPKKKGLLATYTDTE
jgi:hypothetical protein